MTSTDKFILCSLAFILAGLVAHFPLAVVCLDVVASARRIVR
jgi:hypothetical protein